MADANGMPDGTLSEDSRRSPRFTHWLAFLVFSTITLGAAVEAKNNSDVTTASESDQKWAVACAAITFSFTAIVVLMHLSAVASVLIVGTKIEGAIIIMLVAFWAATVSIVTDPRHGLAVGLLGRGITNGNLYYFSWAGFVCAILLMVSYLRSAFHVDVVGEIRTRSARLQTWAALLACSLIVMGASSRTFDNECSSDPYDGVGEDDTFCRRTKFGISLGVISSVFSLAIVAMKIATSRAPFLAEAGLSVTMLIMYAFGVAYLTSEAGPGAALGNLYYFTWGAFLSSFMLTASCSEDYNAAKAMSSESQTGGGGMSGSGIPPSSGEVQIESLDDTI